MTDPYRTPAVVATDPCTEVFEYDRGPTRRRPFHVRLRHACTLAEHHDSDCIFRVVSRTRITPEEFVLRRFEPWSKMLRAVVSAVETQCKVIEP